MVTLIPEFRQFDHSDLMSYAIRMIIPMKREFGMALDVQHFLHDFAYAKEILEVAVNSQDTRLRDNALYIETKIFGPRSSAGQLIAKALPVVVTSGAVDVVAAVGPAPAVDKSAAESEVALTEDQMRARMMAKYKTGLR